MRKGIQGLQHWDSWEPLGWHYLACSRCVDVDLTETLQTVKCTELQCDGTARHWEEWRPPHSGPSANVLLCAVGFCFCFVFLLGGYVFCLLTQLKTLETVPVQWIYKFQTQNLLEIEYPDVTALLQLDVRLQWERSLLLFLHWRCPDLELLEPLLEASALMGLLIRSQGHRSVRSILILAALFWRVASVWLSHVIRLNFKGSPCDTCIWYL